jgi:hypothetical protein
MKLPAASSGVSCYVYFLSIAASGGEFNPKRLNDNPFSKSAFKTLKYRPGYSVCFGSIEDARLFCREFFTWYNTEHRHSGIAMVTPENVHYHTHQEVLCARSMTLPQAYQEHPERFVKRSP